MPHRITQNSHADAPTAHRLPPLVMVRAFEAAGRTGSMRRAAADIGVSHTVISRHVRNLEGWLGRKLVHTSPRGIVLTAEGEAFLAAVSRAFKLISTASTELRPQRKSGVLRIWCIPGLATRWLAPRLAKLERDLDSAEIELHATDVKPDFRRQEADVFVGYQVAEQMPAGAGVLVRPRTFPAASPQWLAAHDMPRDLAELATLPLIHEANHLQWTNWFEAMGYHPPGALRGPRLSDASISCDAAIAGQGIALVNDLMAADELASGRLVQLFESNVTLGSYYFLARAGVGSDGLVEKFRAWMWANARQPEAEITT